MAPDRALRRPEREKTRQLARAADRICALILHSDLPEVDIAIERSKLRETVEKLFPEKLDLYEMIYESRFDRLMEQFRPPPEWR